MQIDTVKGPGGLYVPVNYAEREAVPAPDFEAVATTLNGRDITRGYVLPQVLMLPEDTILRNRGGGDLRLYENLLTDYQVQSTFAQRRGAVIGKECYVEAGGKRAIDKRAAASLEAQIKALNLDSVTDKMLYGEFYGFSVGELLYARDGREIVVDDIKVRKSRRFRFDGAQRLRLITYADMMGELVPDRKFWLYVAGGDNDDAPYGLGLGHYCYWPVLFKRNDLRFWLIFLEKFGMPTAKGTYRPGATPTEKQRLLAALAAITTDSGVIVPDGMAIELLEAARNGSADYEALLKRMDDAISKIIVGHTGVADSTPGKLGNENMAAEVRSDLIKSSADKLCASFNDGPAKWLTDWNYPGAAYPKLWRRTEPPADQKQRSEVYVNLRKAGFKPTLDQVNDEFDGEFEEVAAAPPGADATPAGKPTGADFAEPADVPTEDDIDELAAAALDDWQPLIEPVIDPIRQLAESAEDETDFRAQLAALIDDMDASALVESLTLATFKARGLGDAKDNPAA